MQQQKRAITEIRKEDKTLCQVLVRAGVLTISESSLKNKKLSNGLVLYVNIIIQERRKSNENVEIICVRAPVPVSMWECVCSPCTKFYKIIVNQNVFLFQV